MGYSHKYIVQMYDFFDIKVALLIKKVYFCISIWYG